MVQPHTAIIHGCDSHTDDCLAVAITLYKFPTIHTILRKKPDRLELDDPAIVVLDVGEEYNPALLNFDHHQNPNLNCAFRLIMNYFGLDEAGMAVLKWYWFVDYCDRKGAEATANHLGISLSMVNKLLSPVQGFILSKMNHNDDGSDRTAIHRGEFLFQYLEELGEYIYTYTDKFRDKVKYIAIIAERWVAFDNTSRREVVLSLLKDTTGNPTLGFREFLRTHPTSAHYVVYKGIPDKPTDPPHWELNKLFVQEKRSKYNLRFAITDEDVIDVGTNGSTLLLRREPTITSIERILKKCEREDLYEAG